MYNKCIKYIKNLDSRIQLLLIAVAITGITVGAIQTRNLHHAERVKHEISTGILPDTQQGYERVDSGDSILTNTPVTIPSEAEQQNTAGQLIVDFYASLIDVKNDKTALAVLIQKSTTPELYKLLISGTPNNLFCGEKYPDTTLIQTSAPDTASTRYVVNLHFEDGTSGLVSLDANLQNGAIIISKVYCPGEI